MTKARLLRSRKANPARLRLSLINPDGVTVRVDWAKFRVGASVFIPCINTIGALLQVRQLAMANNWTVQHKVHIEKGKWGIRFWRTS